MRETRLYRVILQVALEVEGDDETYWPDVDDDVRDRRNWEYDLVRAGWDPVIVSALVLDDDPARIDEEGVFSD
jgi:hypothetical protein